MWFDDEEPKGGRLFRGQRSGSRNTILKVNTRFADRKNSQKVGTGVLLAVIVVGITIALWIGCEFVGRILFSENDRFRIKNLNIQEGTVITRDLIKEYTQIKEGMNLFSFDIAKIRKDFIRQSPNVKTMEIRRQLPDTLQIRIVERLPVARVGKRCPFLADGEGYVFGARAGYRELPVITGYRDPSLKPGGKLNGISLAALEVMEVCYDQKIGLHIEEVEVNHPEFLVLYVPDGNKVKEITLAWRDMGNRTAESRKELVKTLGKLVEAMQSEKGRQSLRFNATLDGRIYADGGITAG